MEQLRQLDDVLKDELRDLYNAENQLLKALPQVIKKASSPMLKNAISAHLKETEKQVDRLERIGKSLDIKMSGKTCKAMKGLIEEGSEIIKECKGDGPLIDAMLIGAAQRIEHYEMAGYGTARAIAETLGHTDVVELLQETLDEEGAANKKLTAISEDEILPACNESEESEGEEEEEGSVFGRSSKKGSSMHAKPKMRMTTGKH